MKDAIPRCRHLVETTSALRPYAVATVSVIPWSGSERRVEDTCSGQLYLCQACHGALFATFRAEETLSDGSYRIGLDWYCPRCHAELNGARCCRRCPYPLDDREEG